jgi:hypothetical protein
LERNSVAIIPKRNATGARPLLNANMDTASEPNGLEKFLPRSIAAKRRRNKGSSASESSSLHEDVAPQRGGIVSRSNPGSDTNSLTSLTSLTTSPNSPSSLNGTTADLGLES